MPKSTSIKYVIPLFLMVFYRLYAFGAPTLEQLWSYGSGLSNFGRGIQSGDVNGDGYLDVATVDTYYSSNKGQLLVFFGGPTADNVPDLTISGAANSDWLGYFGHCFDVADINLDGIDDIIVSAVGNDDNGDDAGKIYIFFGYNGIMGELPLAQANYTIGGNITDRKILGFALKVGMFNEDAYPDIAVAAGAGTRAVSSNILYYLNDAGSFPSSIPDKLFALPSKNLGGYNSYVIDFNNDGYDEYIVQEQMSDVGKKVYLFQGGASLPDTYSATFSQDGADSLGYLMPAIAAYDLNADGFNDICMGAKDIDDPLTNIGKVFCWYGSETLRNDYNYSNADFSLTGFAENENFGRSLAFGDINNDGYEDLLVAAYMNTAAVGQRYGAIYVFLGDGSTLASTPWLSYTYTDAELGLGVNLYTLDWDNDEWEDIIIGQMYPTYALGMYNLEHGDPGITVNTEEIENNKVVQGTATDADTDFTFGGIQWSTSNTPTGTWFNCTADDGTFDETEEDFTCDISSLDDGTQAVYLRSFDQNGTYIPQSTYTHTGNILYDTTSAKQNTFVLKTLNTQRNTDDVSINRTNEPRIKIFLGSDSVLTDVTQMKISKHHDLDDAHWRAYKEELEFELSDKEGDQTVYAQFKDQAGNVSDIFSQTLEYDKTPPVFSLTNIGNIPYLPTYRTYYHTSTKLSFRGISEKKAKIKLYLDGNKYTETKKLLQDGEWGIDNVELSADKHHLKLFAEDNADNESAPIEFDLVIDPTGSSFPEQLRHILGI